jgi:hypothetical protein
VCFFLINIDKKYNLFVKVCFIVYICVLQPPRKLNVMKKLIVLAVIFQIITSCGENSLPTTNQKNVRLDSFESMRYNAFEEVKKDSLEIAKVI